ncbi:MAG: polyphenol oxidase family protein [bacterium]
MEIVQSALLNQIPGLTHGFIRPGGNRNRVANLSFKNGPAETVRAARRQACGMLGIPAEHLTHVYQEHGTVIWTVSRDHRGAGAWTGRDPIGHGDGMITREARVPLAILIADCLPVFFTAPHAAAVGIAHAGWKGTLGNISARMVERLAGECGIEPAALRIWIGPGISLRGFTVQDDVWGPFQEAWGRHPECFDAVRRAIDLKQINRRQLMEAGVLDKHIDVSPDCTYSDPRFFSYRRDGAGGGHNLAVIQRYEDGSGRG